MKRRDFLQLAAGAAAGVVVQQASPAFASQLSLRVASVTRDSAPAIVLLPGTVPVTEPGMSLAVSGWMDADDVIHVMMEKPHSRSNPEIVFPILQPGRRYRIRLMNATAGDVPVHLPCVAELVRVEQAPVRGIFTGSIRLKRYGVVEADLTL
jgi:hypothetical protein